MPSRKIRFAFTVTSLAPLLVVYGLVFLDKGPFWSWDSYKVVAVGCFALAIALILICDYIIRFYSSQVDPGPVTFTSLRVVDRSAITFVVVYLLPVVTTQGVTIRIGILALIIVVLAWLVYYSEAYLVNPLLAMWPFKYHFYEVTDTKQTTFILVSRREIVDVDKILDVRKVSTFMFFEVEEPGLCSEANGNSLG